MITQDAIEEVLVAIVERGEPDVSLQGVGLAGDVLVDPAGLLFDGVRAHGSSPSRPNAARSSGVKALPLLNMGWARSREPR